MSGLLKLVPDLDRGTRTTDPRFHEDKFRRLLVSVQPNDFTDLLGKEYRHNGRGPDHYDCWGLCMEIYKRLGLDLPEFLPAIAEPACIHSVVNNAKGVFREITNPIPYCLVTFMVRPPYVTHIGVVLADTNKFIHLLRRSRVTIERLDLPAWTKRIKGFYLYSPPLEGEQRGGNGTG